MQVKFDSKVSIVMYHYVRDLKKSQYPNIKGLDLALFNEQLSYIQKHYNIITMEQLVNSIDSSEPLPSKAALLTFDDGYIDHYENVLPELVKRKIQGSFFPPAKAILENAVLDVNKIHYILAASETDILVKKIFNEIDLFRNEYQLESNQFYFKKLGISDNIDTKETIFIKRLLQKELPEKLRNIITGKLFEEIIGMNESTFSKQLYMNTGHLKEMLSEGMHIGHHGYDHYWLNSLTESEQKAEISKGYHFLKDLGVNMDYWTMCYPYGAYNQTTLNILAEYKCKLALTTVANIANLSEFTKYELPRLDTNDIPKFSLAPTEKWFLQG